MIHRPAAWVLSLGLVVGCGPESGGGASDSAAATETSGATDPTDSAGTTGPSAFEEMEAEYEACGRPHVPRCVGLECATDDTMTKYMTMALEEIEAAGVGGWIRAADASHNPDTQQLLFVFQAQVEWSRYWEPASIDTDDPDETVRMEIRDQIDRLNAELPADIVDLQFVVQEAAACDGMEYTLCIGHVRPGHIWFLRETGDPCNGGRTDEFRLDLVTGESTCTLDAPVACG